jgi:predicted nuclease of predicted toxin-antitoxin system
VSAIPPRELLLDSHLSRKLCRWLKESLGYSALHASDLGFRQTEDARLFFAARARNSILISKDVDFVKLLQLHGPPPSLIYLTCGNTHNSVLRGILQQFLPQAIAAFEAGESIVEIGGK